MARRGSTIGLPDIRELGRRVDRWRRERKKRSPMPADLWKSATALARVHGVYTVSDAIGLSYAGLKNRVERGPKDRSRNRGLGVRFVELPRVEGSAHREPIVVDVLDADGTKLTIRVPADQRIDVLDLVRAWRR